MLAVDAIVVINKMLTSSFKFSKKQKSALNKAVISLSNEAMCDMLCPSSEDDDEEDFYE